MSRPQKTVEMNINDTKEVICFNSFNLVSKRQAYEIEQTIGLNQEHEVVTAQDIIPFKESSIEGAFLSFIKTGNPAQLLEKGLWLTEDPGKDEISRNLAFYDPSSNVMYTVGGIGLVRLDKNKDQLYL